MAERNLIERLDEAIDAILADRTTGLALADPELAMMLVVAADLRELPDPRFKSRLKAELIPQTQKEEPVSSATALARIPGFHTVTPYLIARGASDLITFMRDAFGAEERSRAPLPDGSILHAEVKLGNSMIELGDAGGQWEPKPATLHLYVDDVRGMYERAIAAGATSIYAPVDQAYGDREAGVADRFGNQWFIANRVEEVPEEEMMRRFQSGWKGTLHPMPGVGPAPKGFWTVTQGLRVEGADRLLRFLKEAFGAEELTRTPRPDGTIAHAEMRIGDSILEASEARPEWPAMTTAIHLFVDDCDAVYERAVRAGATSLMPPEDKHYGERGAAIVDPFGNHWYIATPIAAA